MKILAVVGTRPEAIKTAPVIRELAKNPALEVVLRSTGQHRQMLDQVLELFEITPQFELSVMTQNQSLTQLSSDLLSKLGGVLAELKPDLMLVQGDTTTAFVAGLAAFYQKIPVGHIEAGLRTYEMYSPFPEEMNRRLLSALAALHFAPTQAARQNLLREGVPGNRITVTGNTGIDALKIVVERLRERPPAVPVPIPSGQKMILVTLHRRESFGEGIENVCEAMRELAKREDVEIVLPVHLNPNVRGTVQRVLSGVPRVHLVEPLDYLVFASLLSRCHLVITDSGGIQEEATSVGKPILVTRESTERPEALESGCAGLVGTDPAKILREATLLLDDPTAYKKAARPSAAFGTGEASRMIAKRILENRSEGA